MNKRFVVCVVLSLVMCLVMAFPAFAATVDKYDWAEKYDPILDYMFSQRPAGYNYHAVLLSGSGNVVTVYFFKTSVISSTAMSYYRMSYTVSTGVYSSLTNYADGVFYWFLNSSTSPAVSLTTTSAPSFSYYVVDRSTVKPYNHSEAENKWKDIEWQINLGPHWPYPDISALQALINIAKAKTNTGYTSTSWQTLQSAITSAENLLKTTGYTQSQVDNAKNTLQAALNGLQLLPDTAALQALINQAKGMEGNYTPESWQALQLAITAAENLLKTTDYTQSQVDSAKNTLQSALNGLEFLPDTAELCELLVEADQIDDIGYTVPTWTRFDNARADGHSLMARPSYTQSEVNAATVELASAMNGLAFAVVDPPVDPPVVPPSWNDYPATDIDSIFGSERASTYLDIGGGFSTEHLVPAITGIKENVGEARNFGIWVFIVIIVILITTRILRSMIGIDHIDAIGSHEKVFNLGMTDEKRSAFASNPDLSHKDRVLQGSEYRGAHLSGSRRGEKSIDW